MSYSVIIPALNEAETVGDVVRRVVEHCSPRTEVLVVDNGSTDDTVEIALREGARVVHEPRRGKGNALRIGAEHATKPILVFIDADGEYFPEDIPKLVKPLEDGTCDLMYASRLLGDTYRISSPKHRLFGSHFFAWLASKMYMPISDILTGMYAMRKETFEALDLTACGFDIEADIFVQAYRNKLKIGEISTTYKRSSTSHLSPACDGTKILKTLLLGKLN